MNSDCLLVNENNSSILGGHVLISPYKANVLGHTSQSLLDTEEVLQLLRNELRRSKTTKIRKQLKRLTTDQRSSAVNWMFDVARLFRIQGSTLALAVAHLDRYINITEYEISQRHLQVVALAAMVIASKTDEFAQPKIEEWAAVISGSSPYNLVPDLIRMESVLLETLEYRTRVPTAHSLVYHLLNALLVSKPSKPTDYQTQASKASIQEDPATPAFLKKNSKGASKASVCLSSPFSKHQMLGVGPKKEGLDPSNDQNFVYVPCSLGSPSSSSQATQLRPCGNGSDSLSLACQQNNDSFSVAASESERVFESSRHRNCDVVSSSMPSSSSTNSLASMECNDSVVDENDDSVTVIRNNDSSYTTICHGSGGSSNGGDRKKCGHPSSAVLTLDRSASFASNATVSVPLSPTASTSYSSSSASSLNMEFVPSSPDTPLPLSPLSPPPSPSPIPAEDPCPTPSSSSSRIIDPPVVSFAKDFFFAATAAERQVFLGVVTVLLDLSLVSPDLQNMPYAAIAAAVLVLAEHLCQRPSGSGNNNNVRNNCSNNGINSNAISHQSPTPLPVSPRLSPSAEVERGRRKRKAQECETVKVAEDMCEPRGSDDGAKTLEEEESPCGDGYRKKRWVAELTSNRSCCNSGSSSSSISLLRSSSNFSSSATPAPLSSPSSSSSSSSSSSPSSSSSSPSIPTPPLNLTALRELVDLIPDLNRLDLIACVSPLNDLYGILLRDCRR